MKQRTGSWVEIYSDGAYSHSRSVGGWAAVLRFNQHVKEISGQVIDETTSNRMELQAVIEALKALKKPCMVAVYTDSQYVQKGISEWIKKWKRNGWRTAAKKPVINQDLWQELDQLRAAQTEVIWNWVRGHSGHPQNERADFLANREANR
ncbi:MAG: ribonuclease HI [Geminicoccaceae bacterium]